MFKTIKLIYLIVVSACIAEDIIVLNPDQVTPELVLVKDNRVTLSIESNRSTGYQWLIIDQSDSVHVDSMEYISDESHNKAVGSPGYEKITISLKPENNWSSGHIILKYTRPWAPDELGERVTVNFKPSP